MEGGTCQRLLLDQAASCFSAKYLAAAKIKFVLQRFVKKIKARRNDAAVTLQRASRRRANRKATEKQRRDDAASLIGKVARGKAAVTAAKSHKDTLLLERQRDEESDSALRSIQRLRENVAAGVIQAASRGRYFHRTQYQSQYLILHIISYPFREDLTLPSK